MDSKEHPLGIESKEQLNVQHKIISYGACKQAYPTNEEAMIYFLIGPWGEYHGV